MYRATVNLHEDVRSQFVTKIHIRFVRDAACYVLREDKSSYDLG